MKKSKSQIPNKSKPSPVELTEDEAVIFDESAHIADRDQLFGVDHKSFPPNTDALYDDDWIDDANLNLNEDRSEGKDFVNALRDLTPGSRPVGPTPNRNESPTVADRAEEVDDFELMSDRRLRAIANAMAIPERARMTRSQMIEAVRSIGGPH